MVDEIQWFSQWCGNIETWPTAAILNLDAKTEEPWFADAYRMLFARADHKLIFLDLQQDWSKLKELEHVQLSFFSSKEYFYIRFPARISQAQVLEAQRILSLSSLSWILVNPPAKLASGLNRKYADLNLSSEKPWERQDRWRKWLTAYCKKRGKSLLPEVFEDLWQRSQRDRLRLQNECDKLLLCEKNPIALSDVQDLLFFKDEAQVWALVEKVLKADPTVFSQIPQLLLSDSSGILSVNIMRKQWQEGIAWLEKQQVPLNLRRWSAKRQEEQKRLWTRQSIANLQRALAEIFQALFALKNGQEAQVEVSRLLAVLLNLMNSAKQGFPA